MMPLPVLTGAPEGPEEFTVYTVTPGLLGFICFLLLAVAGWLLFRSLSRHMRRLDRNARLLEEERANDPGPVAAHGADGHGADGAESSRTAPEAPDPSASPDQPPR